MKITIRQYVFSVREPFSEGTIITKAEAQALNALRAENIRNNMAKKVADAALPPDAVKPRLLSEIDLVDLQQQITEYDLKYTFPLRGDKKDPVGLVELEIELLAKDRVEAQMRQDPTSLVWSRFKYDKALEQAQADAGLQGEARRRVAARQQAAAKALQELL